MARPWILDYDSANCTIGATVDILGERPTFLVLREAFNGVRRFDDMQRRTGIPRQVLTQRLSRLVDGGLLRKVPYQENGQRPRSEYRLTEKGLDLYPVVISLLEWGERWMTDEQAPPVVELRHRTCGATIHPHLACPSCGDPLTARDIEAIDRRPDIAPIETLEGREARETA